MTPRDAILARLVRSPATMAEIYDALIRYANASPGQAYQIGFATVAELIKDGAVEHFQPLNVYRLTGKMCPEGDDGP